MINADSVSSLI